MSAQYRLVSAFRACNGGLRRPSVRAISTSLPRRAAELPTDKDAPSSEPEIDAITVTAEESTEAPKSYRDFMNKIGYQYRLAEPRNWLGGHVPFPMNPSFKPPPPVSNEQKDVIWALYQKEPITNSVRRLAKRFNLSHRRLDAILRLKGMETDWIKQGKELQTGFQKGMDRVLQAQTHSATPKFSAMLRNEVYKELQRQDFTPPEINPERADVHKADMLEQEERRDLARDRYQRLYWEAIPESADEPVLPSIIQHVKMRAELKSKAEADKKKIQFMKQVPDTKFIRRPSRSAILKARSGKTPTMFVDVGAEFMDVRDIFKRAASSRRKAAMRARKSVQK
ncbi:eukaryotic mitochondrial regulator protein-domain-containing protein [Crepidotus variabilis]|uniref:Eukaryotic mitochondrial regulator protein-domain-containing protein n=1 Tax=Crepidotus variabilis TaxID=179855 RepID=A0A9P6EP13_9AGAR|nr:eukaryotic mitochondrial regulator protein-domain-containing protein [Crepidotus variabilis]